MIMQLQMHLKMDEKQPLIIKKPPTKNVDTRMIVEGKVGCLEKRRRRKGLRQFYEDQDRLMQLYEHDEEALHGENLEKIKEECDAREKRRLRIDRILASLTFSLNIGLLFGNLFASLLSGSYAVISAFIDSAMDTTSSIIVYTAAWAIKNTNMFAYPRGRQRLELVAVIICSVIMGVANIMMIIQSIEAIVTNSVDPDANLPTVAILVGGSLLKVLLMIVCYMHGTPGSKTLALDQRNDIITGIVALLGATIGDYYWKYADPIGAILVCTFVALSWFSNAFSHIPFIVGKRADKELISRILRIAVEHDSRINCLDHIMVYHIGERALVELHVVMDEHLSLKISHDVASELQQKIQALDFVERAFIHVDYSCDGDD
uniref:Cation efflux protein cytoplasmic domain-containing protein n=1 Tax=Acrobeloides nanus TaxID=290746 RepID=A0A914DRM1_9BILA